MPPPAPGRAVAHSVIRKDCGLPGALNCCPGDPSASALLGGCSTGSMSKDHISCLWALLAIGSADNPDMADSSLVAGWKAQSTPAGESEFLVGVKGPPAPAMPPRSAPLGRGLEMISARASRSYTLRSRSSRGVGGKDVLSAASAASSPRAAVAASLRGDLLSTSKTAWSMVASLRFRLSLFTTRAVQVRLPQTRSKPPPTRLAMRPLPAASCTTAPGCSV
mmetsp:Transcript_51159/g.133094  ORF Transcript_51159/g.133094 Transcript_51159/m.133094 type:complete len:221 (-) Transcript_51159:412-1074(-)